MRTQLKYVIIPTTAVTVSFIRAGYHYNLKHNLFARKHPFSAPIQPLKTSQYCPHPILSRCMTARGGSYTFYNNIPYYIYRHSSDRYRRKKGRRHLHRRHNESPGRQGCGQTGGSQGAEGKGEVGGRILQKTGWLCGFFRFYVYLCPIQRRLRLLPTPSPRAWRYRRRRPDNSAGGWDYAPWSPGLCTRSLGLCARSPGARTKDKRYI